MNLVEWFTLDYKLATKYNINIAYSLSRYRH